MSALGPALIENSRFLDTNSTATRKFSSSISGDNPATWVTSDWHSGRSRVVCRVAGRDRRELGRVEMRECGLSDEALDAGRAKDKLEGGRWDRLDDGRCTLKLEWGRTELVEIGVFMSIKHGGGAIRLIGIRATNNLGK